MILTIDTTNKEFVVTKPSTAKVDQIGQQRTDKTSGLPMWSTQVVVTDDDGGEIITITTAGGKPDFAVGDLVEPRHLVAIPWATNGRSGIAYRAESLFATADQ